MRLYPNDGSGDALVFYFTGPHIQFGGLGGMQCYDCFTEPIYGDPGFGATCRSWRPGKKKEFAPLTTQAAEDS